MPRRPPQIRRLCHEILQNLGRVDFATRGQLAYWCKVQRPTISRAASELFELGLVETNWQTRPAIWYLSHAGAAMINVVLPAGRRRLSWSIMSHACHRNAVEIALHDHYGEFRFLPRRVLLKQGFNPTHGEHAGIDATGKSWFVLVDDYLMNSRRIARAWRRRHTPELKYWPDATGRAWCEVMHRYIVACTDPIQAATHRVWLADCDIPADVIDIPALWPL
ncbi:MAG: hypothetical protein ACYDDO_00755 [Acidiferrobacterales bacterium]